MWYPQEKAQNGQESLSIPSPKETTCGDRRVRTSEEEEKAVGQKGGKPQ